MLLRKELFVHNGGFAVPWVCLAGAISLEVLATLNLKTSDGFSRLWPSIVVVLGYIGSFVLLGAALKKLDVGLVYAIWSGAGTTVVVIIGIALFGEPANRMRLAGVAVIVLGVVLVNLSGQSHGSLESTSAIASSPLRHVRGEIGAGPVPSSQGGLEWQALLTGVFDRV